MFIHIQIHGGIVRKYAFYSLALWAEILCAELASANDTNKPEFVKRKKILQFRRRGNRRSNRLM